MKKAKKILNVGEKLAVAAAALASIAAPLNVPAAAQTKQTQQIQEQQTKKNSVVNPVVQISNYNAPRRFTEGAKQGRRRNWSRGPMSRFKQQLQHKKYATK